MYPQDLDLRGLPTWERAARILEVFDRLGKGESALFVTDNEPRGLGSRIEQSRRNEVLVMPQRVADREWQIRVTRSGDGLEVVTPEAVLRRALACAPIAEKSYAPLTRHATIHNLRRGQVVRGEGEDWPYLGIVCEGTLALTSRNSGARQRIFYEIFPFEVFGETEFFDGAPASARVVVLSKNARYLRLPREAVSEAAAADPQLYAWIGRIAVARVRDMIEALVDQASMPIIARISQVLVRYAIAERGLQPALAPLPNMTQSQIAAAAGTVKEVAARAIAELETRGLLKRERGHVRYLDRQGLVDLIKGESQ